MFANVGGRRLYYELRGNPEGPTLVMLRGFARHTLHWGSVLSELESRFYLLLLDNRGLGRSDAVRYPFTVSDMADDVAGVMDAANISRAHVLGSSLGGMAALRFAVDHGARLDRLVLVGTTAGGRKAPPPSIGAFVKMLGARLGSAKEAMMTEVGLVLGKSYAAEHPEIIEEWCSILERYPVPLRTLAFQALAVRMHDVSSELGRIGAPALVLCCRTDHIIPPDNSRMLARGIAGAELAWLDGDAHDVTTSFPRESALRIEEFLLRPVGAQVRRAD